MTPTTPLVSIALCTYNGEQYLNEQLQTLLNQTYQHLEILAVDDGSSDRTVEILEGYASQDKRLKVIVNEKNLGYVKNFEKAIHTCTGNYIALADQDDLWALDKIEVMLNAIGDAVLAYHDSEFINGEGHTMGKMSDIVNMYHGDSPLPFLFYNCVSGHSCMINRTLISALGTFNSRFYHDWWIAYVATNAGHVAYIDRPLVQYRQHRHSSTDILRMKEKPKGPSVKYAEMNLPWLQNCLRIEGKYNQLIERIIYLYTHKTLMNVFRLMGLLFKHYHKLYFIKKKSNLSKLNYIRKMTFYSRVEN